MPPIILTPHHFDPAPETPLDKDAILFSLRLQQL
jgi:hypothetical protein